MHNLSFIIPTLNEEEYFTQQQPFLQSLLQQGHEIIVVDGGSTDKSVVTAKSIGCICISTKPSRGYQLRVGAEKSTYPILVFMHADTTLPSSGIDSILKVMSTHKVDWGRFNVVFTNQKYIFKIIAWFMNKRSCLSGIVTGDHTLFVKRSTYFERGGFSDIPIMEDIEFSKRLKKYSHPACLNETVTTSSRRWEQQGVIKTIILMWRLRILFYFGVPVEKLAKQYYSS
jgi:rSAM/selenodomain-associated transferase 2